MKIASLALSLMLPCTAAMAQTDVVINEVMQSNIDYLMVDKDYPDSWVELYNPSDKTVNLGGWYFGEKADINKAWKLPADASIPAKGHFIIYCDKEAKGIHTDFRVDAGKANLYLMNKDGEVIDQLSIGEQPAPNIAYGRVTDGAEEWQYEFTPTVGAANTGAGVADAANILPAPVFSVPGGLYSESMIVTITLPEGLPADATIFYTTDGSEPSLTNRAGVGTIVNVPVKKSTVIRAKIMTPRTNSSLSGRSLTQSYIFHPREVTMPVISLSSNRDDIYSTEYGILTSAVNNGTPNYMQKWRRPINIEYYDIAGNAMLNQLGETAISGVSTREQPQKSMKIYTNKRFGKKNFKTKLWEEDKPWIKKVKSFVIRCGGNPSFEARINDALVQKLFGSHVDDEDLDWQAYKPVIVYLNGAYLGEFGLRERSNEDFVEANYDGMEDIELADEASYQKPEAGSLFEQFRNSYRNESTTYEELDAQMDMNNFIKSVIAEIYANNTDFPTNNVSLWRPLEDGGKWRWILKDLDRFGYKTILNAFPMNFNMFRYLFTPDDIMFAGIYNFDLYAKMATLPEFRDKLVETFAIYLGDFLRPEVGITLMENMHAEIESELKPTFSLYNESYSKFNEGTNILRRAINERPAIIYQQMSEFFDMGASCDLAIENSDTTEMRINGVRLTEGDFQGKYFLNHPLRLNAGESAYAWEVKVEHTDGTTDVTVIKQAETEIVLNEYSANSSTDKVTLRLLDMGDISTDIVDLGSKSSNSHLKYIDNNRVVILKDGIKYNAGGQTIK